MSEILDRYLDYNSNANSYTWKILDAGEFRPLDMTKTLLENGVNNYIYTLQISDEADEFEFLEIERGYYYPIIHLYYNDDLV